MACRTTSWLEKTQVEEAPECLASAQVLGDDGAELLRVEVGQQQVEVERLAQTLRAGVAGAPGGVHPGLGDGGARRRVLVEERAPLGVDLVHLVAVPERVRAIQQFALGAKLRLGGQRVGHVLGQRVGHVDAEAVHAAVGPEAQGLQEVVADLAVVPVQVRLLRGEEVHVPLAGGAVRFRDALPGRPPKTESQSDGGNRPSRVPGRRGRCSVRGPAEPFGAARASWNHSCRLEEWLGTMSAISLMPAACRAATISSKSSSVPELGVHVAVVVHVVAAVGQGRGVERAQPDGVDAQGLQVRNLGGDAPDVAQAVPVGVGEAARVDLVHGRLAPPVRIGHAVGHGRPGTDLPAWQRKTKEVFLRVWGLRCLAAVCVGELQC